MKTIESGYDNLIRSNYELWSTTFNEFKVIAKSWYTDTDFSQYDNRYVREDHENRFKAMKYAGLMTNYFFVYKEDDTFYLLDGFNRLFTSYGNLDIDCPILVKVITDKQEAHDLMRIMFFLNMWKLQGEYHNGFSPDNFFDRGFRLLLSKKFDVNIYTYDDYHTKTRERSDFEILHQYFRNQYEETADFSLPLDGIGVLLSQKNIIEDLKELIKSNDYLYSTIPFKNFTLFLNGFAMFLSWRRVNGDNNEYKFQTYIDKLYEDNKFFKKLQGMSGNDSTRKNIYIFYRNSI